MAINIKTVWMFQAQKWGWTETYYIQNIASLSAARDLILPTLTARRNLLGLQCALSNVRFEDVATGQTLNLYGIGTQGATSGPTVRDTAWQVLLVQLQTAVGLKKNVWVRGVSDDWINYDAVGNPVPLTGGQNALIDLFVSYLNGSNKQALLTFAQRYLSRALLDTAPSTVVGAAVDGASTYTLVTTALNHGYSVGDEVRIKGCAGSNAAQLNSVFTVFSVPSVSTFVVKVLSPVYPVVLTHFGACKRRIYRLSNIVGGGFIRFSKHDTGKPFFRQRGARPARKH